MQDSSVEMRRGDTLVLRTGEHVTVNSLENLPIIECSHRGETDSYHVTTAQVEKVIRGPR